MGKSLDLGEKIAPFGDLRRARVPFSPIRAVVKRRKEIPKELKLVLKIRKILVNQPNRIMPLREFGQYWRFLDLQKG